MIYLTNHRWWLRIGRCDKNMADPSGRNSKGRFFSSTRGRIVLLLRARPQTVDELAAEVQLTDNAIRAHLVTLERDGLIQQGGVRRGPGSGKPASFYVLTPHAESLFPKAYAELLRQLLIILAETLQPGQLEALLRQVVHQVTQGRQASGTLEERVMAGVGFLSELGGLARYEEVAGGYRIAGASCPLAEIVPGNVAACHLAELLLSEVIGSQVTEHCAKGQPPRCCFDIQPVAQVN